MLRHVCWQLAIMCALVGMLSNTSALRQVWQWITHGATLQPGNKPLTKDGFEAALKDELAALRKQARCCYPRFRSQNAGLHRC